MANVEPKVAFDHLYQSLREYQQLFFEGSIKATGFFLLVMGWILTSDKARDFVKSQQSMAEIGGWGLVVCGISYIALCISLMLKMKRLGQELDAIDFLPRSYYEHRLLKPAPAAMWMILAITPCGVIAYYLLCGHATASS